ncbi:hypothetical protein C0993_006488 [Termitomyces sp. T159_Od127]|nr:hypothetical protein C0993_006488 [Termitomyces sp. T159_Od127]
MEGLSFCLDIVALQPDLHRIGSLDLASRITWVHANFLESLPFPDGEFDFVHIKRIALGVPENKWDGLFQEIIRVMKPGGTLEMLEEDIFFPGKSLEINEKLDIDIESEKRSLVLSSHHGSTKSYSDTNFESLVDSGPPSFRSSGHSPPTSTTATFPATPSRSNSPVADVLISEDMEKEAREILSYAIGDDYILPPEDGQILNEATARGHLQVKTPQSVFASSMVSLNPSSAGSAAAPDSETSFKSKSRTRSRAHSLSVFLSSVANSQQPSPVSEVETLLLRTVPKPPPNPRDHSLLEAIYTRLLKSRSISISPLALLADHVGYYFQDVRTLPPLQYHFPIILQNDPADHDGGDSESDSSSSDDTDDARDAILPSPVSRTSRRERSRRTAQNRKEGIHHVGGQNHIHHTASYLTLDESSASTLSPSIKGMSPDTSSASPQRGLLLPNTSVHVDAKTLSMHLALRVAEIVACSEAMWEWVQRFSAKVKARREREAAGRPASRPCRSGSGSIEMPTRRSNVSIATGTPDPFESSILDLTREDFDGLVSRFEMDMREICDIQNTLRERFSWHVSEPTVSTEREAFDKACEKWDKWEQEQLVASLSHARSHDQIRDPPSGVYVATQPLTAGNRIQGRPVSTERSKKRISNTSGSPLRLSRSMRIFLARKSSGVPSDP